jgi:hypothetical protein
MHKFVLTIVNILLVVKIVLIICKQMIGLVVILVSIFVGFRVCVNLRILVGFKVYVDLEILLL